MSSLENPVNISKLNRKANELGISTPLITSDYLSQSITANHRAVAKNVLDRYRALAKLTSKTGFMNHEIESILDNFFIIETTVFDVVNSFKKKDFKRFPLVTRTKKETYFRLYYVLREYVRAANGSVDKEGLLAFISTYQKYSPFSIRELNTIPIMIRFILVEDFGELITKSEQVIKENEEAEKAYVMIAKAAKRSSWDPAKVTLTLANTYGTIPVNLGLHLMDRLNQDGQKMRPIIKWIRLNLEKQGLSSSTLSRTEEGYRSEQFEHMTNVIESLHWLNQVRWDAIAEQVNVVDALLAHDPAGAFLMLDTNTKNSYRNVVVRIAERVSIHEAEVARTALRLANLQQRNDDSARNIKKHVGYYLVDHEGRAILEAEMKYTPTLLEHLYHLIHIHPARTYFGLISIFTLIFFAVSMLMIGFPTHDSLLGFIGAVSLLFISFEIGIHATNVVLTRIVPARRLPHLDLNDDVGIERRTCVAVPSMIRDEKSISEHVEKLETKYVGNPQKNIYYALLLDFSASKTETLPTDALYISFIEKKIQELNDRYGRGEKIFFALIRKRKWNESENVYMAWERKRGKLREFNELLRGKETSYIVTGGIEQIKDIKYVITLDEDTELPHDSARKLIGTMAHPLNIPIVDQRGKVIRGYGIIQPRVSTRLSIASRSLFTRLYSSASGIDSYSGPVSDIYQDLFDNALFFGKGIYDIDTIEASMKGKIPDNTVLSHDLLEGIYAHTGYASDIVLFDGFPKYYHEFVVRLERWIRGDWQIIGWLSGRFGQGKYGVPVERFAFVDRFKIFDNLRRSLVPVAAVVVLFIGYETDISLEIASMFIALALMSPFALPFIASFVRPSSAPLRLRVRKFIYEIFALCIHSALRIFFLFEQACVSVWAIVRTMSRLYITRKRLLQWKISQDVSTVLVGKLSEYYRAMRVSVILAVVFIVYLILGKDYDEWVMAWCTLWLLAPFVAYLISIRTDIKEKLSNDDTRFIRGVAYRTALYFIDNAKKETNWMIPDHIQESPIVTGENRVVTSPTNIGMHVAGLLSAYELGYISIVRYAERVQDLFTSLAHLRRYKGHFYNWYDINTLEPLTPEYVSSVDSANCLLSFIAVERAYRDIADRNIITDEMVKGLNDSISELVADVEVFWRQTPRSKRKHYSNLRAELGEFMKKQSELNVNISPREVINHLSITHKKISHIADMARNISATEPRPGSAPLIASLLSILSLIEDQMMSIQSLLPYLRRIDRSAELYATHDARILKLVHMIEHEAISGKTIRMISEDIPHKIRALDFERAIDESSLSQDSKVLLLDWYRRVMDDVELGSAKASEVLATFEHVAEESNRYIYEADFSFLYNTEKELFHIGYNASFGRLDSACYNFMASESNSISFVAILKGQAPQKHWFYLSRKLVRAGSHVSLVSWGGSLFEYLTSLIFFSVHKESLLGSTARAAIKVHMDYANIKRTLWGMGESAYSATDSSNRYQYQVFGSARLGLKRNLADFLVVAPYVSALSLPIMPRAATNNLRRYTNERMRGRYGFYDSLDYLGKDGRRLKKPIPAQVYYAHHQGFALCSIFNTVANGRIQQLFHSHPMVRSLDLLFEERMPDAPTALPLSLPVKVNLPHTTNVRESGIESRRFVPAQVSSSRYTFLSNGNITMRMSQSGTSTSYYRGIALTRPCVDGRGGEGASVYIRTNSTEKTSRILPYDTSTTGKKKVVFQENKVEYALDTDLFESVISVSLDPKNPVVIRELDITNKSKENQSFDIVNYGEVSLAYEEQVLHHPHYYHLLVQSEILSNGTGIIFHRPHPHDRTRTLYVAYILAKSMFKGMDVATSNSRTRAYKGYGSFDPFAVFDKKNVSADYESSAPIDPAYALGLNVDLKSGEGARITCVEIVAENRDEIMHLIKKYSSPRLTHAISVGAMSASVEQTRLLGISQQQSVVFQDIASIVLSESRHNMSGDQLVVEPIVNSLWRMGISGDYPIALFFIHDIGDIPTARQIIQCYVYWKWKGISIDIVILNGRPSSYMKILDDEVDFLIRQARENVSGWTGSTIYQVKADHISDEDKNVLLSASCFVADTKNGSFSDTVKLRIKDPTYIESLKQKRLKPRSKKENIAIVKSSTNIGSELDFYNSWGGFDRNTGEYVMTLTSYYMPPKAWSHFLVHEKFGTLITASGTTYTWSLDSYDNRITELSNDSLRYRSGEVIYIRDRATGSFWNPTPFPVKTGSQFIIKYGFGYASYSHSCNGISSELTVFVPQNHSSKVSLLKLKNETSRARSLTIYNVVIPVLGAMPNHMSPHMRFEFDKSTNTMLFSNSARSQMVGRIGYTSFGNVYGEVHVTTSAQEFFGPGDNFGSPRAMKFESLSDQITQGSDNCIAMSLDITLEPGETMVVPIIVGDGDSLSDVKSEQFNLAQTSAYENLLTVVRELWKKKLGMVKVHSGDKSIDLLTNGWLIYQALTSRLYGKTGYYQPSGAYGFRDQLQDVSALIWSDPAFVRSFILNVCAKQFIEGDPLTWWHEHNMFGMRTVLSDHQLWLAHTVYEYIDATGDVGILDENVPFLEGPKLNFDTRKEWTGIPSQSDQSASVYEHIMRAINKSLVFGDHGLPLMGHSDWNDGLSSVGQNGRGESVWVGWFLVRLIDRSMNYVVSRGDESRAKIFSEVRENLKSALDKRAWDGRWYRRAFFDNGTPLGSRELKEFKIDSIAQSWSVLSEVGNEEKVVTAHKFMTKHLLKKKYFALIDPPLSTGAVRPGYIMDYPPGIRENGAQYNHAAMWAIQSYLALGEIDQASSVIDFVNPIKRSLTVDMASHYGVEPYVIASDIYGGARAGEGGWSWYTGSAGLMYRTVIEHMYGIKRNGNILSIAPKFPVGWSNPSIVIVCGSAQYRIEFDTTGGRLSIHSCELDGVAVEARSVPFLDDGKNHVVKVVMG
jgi:cellobiose phosphorylase